MTQASELLIRLTSTFAEAPTRAAVSFSQREMGSWEGRRGERERERDGGRGEKVEERC